MPNFTQDDNITLINNDYEQSGCQTATKHGLTIFPVYQRRIEFYTMHKVGALPA